MSGPVTYSVTPFASTVHVGDDNNGIANEDNGLTIVTSASSNIAAGMNTVTVQARQYANDDADDGTPEGAAAAQAYQKQQIANGTYDQSSIDKGNAAAASPAKTDDTPLNGKTGTPADCTAIHQHFDLTTQLSTHYTLGAFIQQAPAIPKYRYSAVPAQMGLQPDQIVCNLAALALNVWEPIKARYPNAVMTCNLRTGADIGAGPHGTGQACDMQFNQSSGGSIPPADYYDIALWIKDNIAFDQLILEYHTARGPLVAWIHASVYVGTGKQVAPQNRVLTMMNGQLKFTKLAQLAT